MSEERVEAVPTIDHKPHATFFRQSGWLMIATVIQGMMAFGVHPLAKKISPAEYSIFVTMLMLASLIPTMPLQMVFAQQTAGTLATNRGRQLSLMIRWGWLLTFIVWAMIALDWSLVTCITVTGSPAKLSSRQWSHVAASRCG